MISYYIDCPCCGLPVEWDLDRSVSPSSFGVWCSGKKCIMFNDKKQSSDLKKAFDLFLEQAKLQGGVIR